MFLPLIIFMYVNIQIKEDKLLEIKFCQCCRIIFISLEDHHSIKSIVSPKKIKTDYARFLFELNLKKC